MKKKLCNLLLIMLIGPSANAIASGDGFGTHNDTTQAQTEHERIAQNVETFVYERFINEGRVPDSNNLTVKVSKIDPRISISKCSTDYNFDAEDVALDKSFFSVRVSCDENNWFIYASVRTTFTKNVVVLDGTVSPNTVLSRSNLRIDQIDVNRARHTGFTDIEDVIGARMKYRVRDGQPVQRRMLCYVCEGDRITIAARIGTMEVKTSGIAQQDGTIGDTIEVKNTRSKKTVFAQVLNSQQVIVNL